MPTRKGYSVSPLFGDRKGRIVGERFWRDASDRLTFDSSRVDAVDYAKACRAIADALNLTPYGKLVVGLDQMFWDFRREDRVIGLDWDIWMGLIVVAKSESSESLVQEIAIWLGASRWSVAAE